VRPFEAGLRRATATALDVGSEPELVGRIRAEIADGGPITFARFMERALYEPELGYYRASSARPGRSGDFLTAPETHPIFGGALARQLVQLWEVLARPAEFVLREHGAGGGTLAVAIVDRLRRDGSGLFDALRYEPVEIEPRRRPEIAARLSEAGFLGVLGDARGERRVIGCVLANEVLDALPVHWVEQRDGRLREVMVDWRDDAFGEVLAPPSSAALPDRLAAEGIVLAEGQRAEISLAIDGWIEAAAASLERGLLLIVDYGHPAADLYGPRRAAGTLLAYVNHRVHDDPYVNVGRQDLTAHVDLTAVERAAARAGLEPLGSTTQAEFLAGLGIDQLLAEAQRDPAATIESSLALRAGVMRLLDPAATGGFRVLGFGRGLPAGTTLRGFEWRLDRVRPERRCD